MGTFYYRFTIAICLRFVTVWLIGLSGLHNHHKVLVLTVSVYGGNNIDNGRGGEAGEGGGRGFIVHFPSFVSVGGDGTSFLN